MSFYEFIGHPVYRTALYRAVEQENIEIIKLLLSIDNIDVNILSILVLLYIKFKIISFNAIQHQFFLMKFKIMFLYEIQIFIF